MTPPVDTALTEKELEVVRILCELPKLILDAVARRLPRFLRWGTRRHRSTLDNDNSLLSLPPPPPPAPTSPPPDGNDERKDGSRGDGATSSPETPLSFPASVGDEPNSRPPRLLSSSMKALKNPKRGKAFKNTKRHKEVNLFLRWGTRRRRRSALGDDNSLLSLPPPPPPAPTSPPPDGNDERKDGSRGDGATLSPETPLSFPASVGEEPMHSMVEPYRQVYRRRTSRVVQSSLVDRKAVEGSPTTMVVATVRREWGAEKGASLDLNARPEKEKLGMEEEWEQQPSAYKAAMSTQSRKRRLEIPREKNSYSSRDQKKQSRLR